MDGEQGRRIAMLSLRKVIGLLVLLIAFTVASATGVLAQQQKRLAFVIGNAAYPSDALVTSANDAGLIAQTLQAAGFDVVGARDVDQESLRGALRDFLAKVSAAGPDATVFVYLAGRGVQFEGENYFLPVDAQIANPAGPGFAGSSPAIKRSLARGASADAGCTGQADNFGLRARSEPLRRAAALVDRNPGVRVLLRLPLQEIIAGRVPRPNLVDQIVQHEIALVGLHRQDGVALVVQVANHGHQQCLPGKSCFLEKLALVERVDLAIALAVHGIVPVVHHRAPVIVVAHGLDGAVRLLVYPLEDAHVLRGQLDARGRQGRHLAFFRPATTEVEPAIRNAGACADRGGTGGRSCRR
ncbi:exported hypothetical protein [Mesorhizobium sp. ORS 3359]|nr:exported hypothetical protein [Mesorhizobium sp. ORS 3359]